jgi:hypothetical protein
MWARLLEFKRKNKNLKYDTVDLKRIHKNNINKN